MLASGIYRRRGSPRGRPNVPEPPTWIGSGLGLGQAIPSYCANANDKRIGEERSQSPRPPSDSPWPEGEAQRYTIDGRALVKRRRVLASGIEREGAPEGDPTWLGLWLGSEPRRRPNSTRAAPTTQAIPSHCARASARSRGDGAGSQDHVG